MVNAGQKAKVRLRRAYDLSEHILYLLSEAHEAQRYDAINRDVYEEWLAYFDDVCGHPIFLAAVDYGHSAGYFNKHFAGELLARLDLEKNKKGKETIRAIYPDMLSSDWVEQIGKQAKIDGI